MTSWKIQAGKRHQSLYDDWFSKGGGYGSACSSIPPILSPDSHKFIFFQKRSWFLNPRGNTTSASIIQSIALKGLIPHILETVVGSIRAAPHEWPSNFCCSSNYAVILLTSDIFGIRYQKTVQSFQAAYRVRGRTRSRILERLFHRSINVVKRYRANFCVKPLWIFDLTAGLKDPSCYHCCCVPKGEFYDNFAGFQ